MDNRKYCLNGILMMIMVFTVLMAYTAPAFAENAMADSAAAVTADQNGNEKVIMDAAEENPEKEVPLPEDVSAEAEEIYQRIREVKAEFERICESYSDEMEALTERSEELLGKAGREECGGCEWDPWDIFTKDREQPFEDQPGADAFCDQSVPDRRRNENDSHDESEDPDRSDSDRDNPPSWDEIMKVLEKMNGKAAQNDEENETEVRNGKKPYIGLMVTSLSDEVKAVTGVQAGVLVQQVKRNTPAARAGIQAYDILVNVNGTDIASREELASIIAESAPGDVLRIRLYRQGRMLEFDLSPIR